MPKQKRILTEEEKQKIADAKKELNEYKDNIKYIEEKQNDLEEIKASLEKVTTRLSKTKSNNSNTESDKFSEGIARIEDLEKEHDNKLQELIIKKFAIDEKIDKLEPTYRNILFYRYTRAKEWNDIANILAYTRQYVCELHGEALYLYSKL